MASTIRIKKRASSGSAGAPSSLASSELAFNENASDKKLYYGYGDDGNGVATSVIAIGGPGAFVDRTTAQSVAGDKTFSDNVVVTGNLTVNGTTTSLQTTNSVVKDALIELGNGTSGTPANDAGLVIERGSSANAFIGWDESEDKFIVGTGTFTGADTGNLSVTTGTLVSNLECNVTGNVTGNTSGSAGSFTAGNASNLNSGTIPNARIANDSITEAQLDIHNAPTTGYILKYTSNGLEWAAAGAGGENNQNAWNTFSVSGQSDVVADSATDTCTFVAGSNVTITTNASGDSITFASTDTNTTYSAGTGLSLSSTTFSLGNHSGDLITSGTVAKERVETLNQNTTGTAAGLTGTPAITVGDVVASSLDISGNADIDGTLEADAYTVKGTALSAYIASITVADATTANVGTHVTVEDESSDTTCFPLFATAATGNLGAKSGSNLTFNSSTGLLTATQVDGLIDGGTF